MTLLFTAAKTGGSARRMPVSSSSSRAAQASQDCGGGKQTGRELSGAVQARLGPAHLADLQVAAGQRPVARAVRAQAPSDKHLRRRKACERTVW